MGKKTCCTLSYNIWRYLNSFAVSCPENVGGERIVTFVDDEVISFDLILPLLAQILAEDYEDANVKRHLQNVNKLVGNSASGNAYINMND